VSQRTDAPAQPSRDGAAPQQAAEPPQRPDALDAAAVRRVWSEILAAAKQRSRSTGALMVNATVRNVDGDVLVLAIGSEPLARRLSEQRNTDVIADALHAVLGVRWRVRCDHGDAAPPPARPAAPRTAPPPQRPARPAPARPAPDRRSAPDDGEPLPPEPPDEDAPPDDEEAMMAEAAADAAAPTVRRDPEEVAIELLSAQLGATAIERR
jgi:DNA polymerase-3 subunit gamma/tau